MSLKIVEVYFTLIKEKRRTIDQVPENIRPNVQALLDDDSNDS